MEEQRYSANLPSVGLATFFRSPVCEDFSKIDADVAFLGIPYDCGIGFRPGTRFGPREIRSFSVRYSAWGGHKANGYWDVNQRKRFLNGVSMVDCGDVDITYYDFDINRRKITSSIEKILDRGAFPVLIGGDHSVTFPNVCAFSRFGPVDIVHIDAHMDWRDEIGGVRFANASPLRRSKELPSCATWCSWASAMCAPATTRSPTPRRPGPGSSPAQDIRERGVNAVLEQLPPLGNTFVTIDIDGLDPLDRSRHRLADRRRSALSRGASFAAGRGQARARGWLRPGRGQSVRGCARPDLSAGRHAHAGVPGCDLRRARPQGSEYPARSHRKVSFAVV